MTLPIEERDLIDLNAYLDGELTDQERAAFEVRLAQEAALREELRALRATVAILKMAEPVPAPRNFTLNPAMYGRPEKQSIWDQLSTPLKVLLPAGAAILATLVCAGIVILGTSMGGAGAPAVAEQPAMQMAAEESAAEPSGERMADQAPEAEAPLAESAAEGGGANAAGEEMTEAVPQAAEPGGGGGAPPEEAAGMAAAEPADTGGADAAEEQALEAPAAAAPTEAPVAGAPLPTPTAPPDDQQFTAPMPTLAAEVGQAEGPAPALAQAQPTASEPTPAVPSRLLATGVVVGLVVAVLVIVIGAGLALALSRSRR